MKRIIVVALFLLGIGFIFSCSKDAGSPLPSNPVGTGGSLARFTIAGNFLYVVDSGFLTTFNIENGKEPSRVNSIPLDFTVETIYPFMDKLFIGSREGFYIFSIENPQQPKLLSATSHFRACDPIVAHDTVAYVTVRAGNLCGGSRSALITYDVKDVLNPVEKNLITLQNPYGLGLKDQRLFVCEGSKGLKVFSLQADPYNPVLIQNVTGETYYDCIPYGNILIVMIEKGLAIYDISSPASIELLSLMKNE